MKVRFISLASGSSGNCYYLGTDTYGILIDAGIGIRTIKKTLKDFNILMESIRAVFVTHDHADHSLITLTRAILELIASFPPFRIQTLFVFIQIAAMSTVTLGRDS